MEEKDMNHVASHINAKSGVNLEQFITVSLEMYKDAPICGPLS